MALQKSGVQLVAENEAGFLGAMGRAQKSVQGFEGSIAKGTPVLKGMSIGSLALGSALGGALLSGITAAVSGFANLAKSAFTVTAEYERLSISLQTLLAREIRNAGAATDMGTAFDMAAPAARDLLNWIEELAIISPFDQAGVAAAYQTLQVYGFLSLGAQSVAEAQEMGVVSAQRLTEALIDQASVSARGSETMGLVSYALGQIRTSGKLLMQDLRQLMNAGVDVNSILGEMGYSLADVGKEAINSDEFLLQFVETIERDLGGAAERQAGTLSGLANSLADLGKKYLREFFGPFNEGTGQMGGLLGFVQPLLQKFVDTLMDERILKGVQTLGLLIGEGLSGGVSMLATVLTNIVQTIQKPFNQAAFNAFSWGSNIIIQLAQGIINAAGSILISAINFVGQILASWFSPGSPPAIAPEIDTWGQMAMEEFLHGFTEADFSVLKGIQQPLQAALQTMMQAGDIDAQELADTYASLTEGLAAALSGGADPAAIFAQIANETGAFGPELAELARLQFELAGGVEAVTQAEEDLARAREAEENAGKAVMQLTQEYNDLLRGGADDATLQAKLAEINAAEVAKDLAGEQAAEAETQLDIAKANLDVMEAQVRLQQELVNQLIELARLQAQAIPPEEPGETTPGGGGGGQTPPGGGGGIDLPDPGEVVANFIDEIITQIQDAAAAMFAPITEAWDNMVAGILEAWSGMWTNLKASGLLEQLQSIWDSLVALTKIALSILKEFITTGLKTLFNLWETHRAAVLGIWKTFWNLLASIAGGVGGLVVSNVAQRLEELRGFFETNRQQISSIIQLFWGNVYETINAALTVILGFVQDRLNSLQMLWDTYGLLILGAVDRMWDAISAVFFGVMKVILVFVEAILTSMQNFWDAHGENVVFVVTRFTSAIGGVFDLILAYIGNAVLFAVDLMADLWEEHGVNVVAFVQNFLDGIAGIFDAVLGAIGASFDAWAAIFKGDWEGVGEAISDYWQAIWDGITTFFNTSLNGIIIALALFIGSIITYFTNLWDELVGNSIIPEMLAAIESVFTATFDAILLGVTTWITDFIMSWNTFWADVVSKTETKIQEIKDAILNTIDDAITGLASKVSSFTTAGEDILKGLIDGIISASSDVKDAIIKAINDAIAAAKAALGIQSPSKVFAMLGANISFGLAEGITDERRAPLAALSETVNAMINPALVSQPAGNTYSNTMNVNFQNNVSGGMDVAALDNHIIQVVKRAFR